MSYDHYSVAKNVADSLDAEGHTDWAKEIRDAMAEGATGTEVFMGLRWQLRQVTNSGLAISPMLQSQIEELLSQLGNSLGE